MGLNFWSDILIWDGVSNSVDTRKIYANNTFRDTEKSYGQQQ